MKMMKAEREAAICTRKIWIAHDERDEASGWRAASRFYEILGANPSQATYAGFLTIHAYFLADAAQSYQDKLKNMEDFFYRKAASLLEKARGICGFETESPKYTVRWWKAYRHKDKEAIVRNLIAEHKAQLSHLKPKEKKMYARICTQKLAAAATNGHYARKVRKTDKLLEDYFTIFLKAQKKSRD